MAKEAGIKLTLRADAFKSGLRGLEGDAKASGARMGASMRKSLSDGLKGGLDTLKAAGSALKGTIGTIGSLAGGLGGVAGTVALAQGAVKAEKQFKALSFAIRAGTGETVNFRDLQKDAQAVAVRTGQSVEDLGHVMDKVFDATGDADYARQSLATIGTVALATSKPVELVGKVAAELGDKFGVSSADLKGALTDAFAVAKKGGVTFEDMAEKLEQIGANAKEAGLSGVDGFRQMMALMNLSDDALGNMRKGLPAVAALLDQLGTKAERNKVLMKAGLDPSKVQGGAMGALRSLVQKSGGDRDKLASYGFSGNTLQLVAEMGRSYATSYKDASGTPAEKTAAGLDALDAAFKRAGQSTMTFAQMEAEAAANAKSAQAQMDIAIEKLKVAFSRPEFIGAITKLMDRFPPAVDKLVDLLNFAGDHPVAAAAGGAAAIGGWGFLKAALPTMVRAAFTSGAPAAAPAIVGALSSGGVVAGAGIGTALLAAAPYIGGALALAYLAKVAVDAGEEREKQKDDATDRGMQQLEGEQGGTGNSNASGSSFWGRDANGVLKRMTPEDFASPADFDAERERLAQVGGRVDLERAGWTGAPALLPGDAPFDFMRDNGGTAEAGARKAAKPESRGMSKEDAALFAAMMARTKLQVEVVNMPQAALGGPNAGTPTPGPTGRK